MFLSDVRTLPILTTGDFTYRYELEEPPNDDAVMNAARRQMGETPEVMEKAKKELIHVLRSKRKN
jgi:hypothetical protein